MKFHGTRSLIQSGLLVGIAATLFTSVPAAGAGITMSVGSAAAAPGSAMDSFDVDLTNSGASAVTIGGFAFQVSIANSKIDFIDVNTSTAADYIFSGTSQFGPDLSGPDSGQTISASDVFFIPSSGTAIHSGQTLGLGHVVFDVSAKATAGVFPVDLAPYPITSLSDALGNDVNIDVLSPGQITITGPTAVPEPSSFFLFLSSSITAALGARRSRRLLLSRICSRLF